jgi:hypothetical protein
VGSHAAELQNYRAADMLGLHDFASPQIKKTVIKRYCLLHTRSTGNSDRKGKEPDNDRTLRHVNDLQLVQESRHGPT